MKTALSALPNLRFFLIRLFSKAPFTCLCRSWLHKNQKLLLSELYIVFVPDTSSPVHMPGFSSSFKNAAIVAVGGALPAAAFLNVPSTDAEGKMSTS